LLLLLFSNFLAGWLACEKDACAAAVDDVKRNVKAIPPLPQNGG
jgi:hypothetical protein